MTSPLARLERALARLVEGAVDRIVRPQVQPVQIAHRLDAAMEAGVMAGVRGPIAPNAYTVSLSPADHARFAGVMVGLQRDLERHLAETAARLRLRCLDPLLVQVRADAALAPGRLDVRAVYLGRGDTRPGATPAPASTLAAGPVEHTVVMPAVMTATASPMAVLEVAGAEGAAARAVAITGARLTIGRAEDNGLVLSERAVSRHHAVVRRDGSAYLIEDLGSTNGVRVNGTPVKAAALKDGDRVHIGATALVFRLKAAR